ncbi:MAG: hypothetical protein HN577_00580, partial [Rhodospirillaceae bacterium]|nr:hypothetical protein [Rhodospirillaceae bacterium]
MHARDLQQAQGRLDIGDQRDRTAIRQGIARQGRERVAGNRQATVDHHAEGVRARLEHLIRVIRHGLGDFQDMRGRDLGQHHDVGLLLVDPDN